MEKFKLCLIDIKALMTNAKLKLNPSKTEFLLIGTKQHYFYFRSASLARTIGVTFDSELQFDHDNRQICKFCFYHIRDLRQIRRHLSMVTAKMIANHQPIRLLQFKYRIDFKINTLVYETLLFSENKEPVPEELESLFDLALLKPRLVLVLSMLLLHASGIPFL